MNIIGLIHVLSPSNFGADVISHHHFNVASDSGMSEHIHSTSHLP